MSRLLDLFSKNCGIVADITDVQVLPIAEPRHVNREKPGADVRSLQIVIHRAMHAGRGTTRPYHEAHERQCQQLFRQVGTPVCDELWMPGLEPGLAGGDSQN